MSLVEILGLACAAAAGGAINAVAGGGTLVTFPTLLFFHTEPIVANGTSTLALVIGTGGSIYGYRRHLEPVKPWLRRFIPVSLVGGLLGALLLTWAGNRVFAQLVPFLILFATILFLAQNAFRRFAGLTTAGEQLKQHHTVWGALWFQFAVALYGGYFGAGIGILMLASLGLLGLHDIHQMNALKSILGSLINLVAAIWFIAAGLIHWPKAAVMTVGALAGYYLAAHYSQRISQQAVRRIITVIGFALSAITFYQQFLR